MPFTLAMASDRVEYTMIAVVGADSGTKQCCMLPNSRNAIRTSSSEVGDTDQSRIIAQHPSSSYPTTPAGVGSLDAVLVSGDAILLIPDRISATGMTFCLSPSAAGWLASNVPVSL
ncbi:hypothetical protein PGTUg99_032334 [Puccinia graminis f. sp. tritici]|uniref:Uncharacterized protein n=1 Tax=Puccinia graminis f. sp. tritici TaxID=56615 RepID=A0A5B0SKJ8_PUCGR|nr:hypothetical protein PGTUg99_032334 [Puccinia graminis f. sp. tritici]